MQFKERSHRVLPFAALQTAPLPGDPAGTLARFAEQVRAIRTTFPAVRLVVAPELHLAALPGLLDATEDPAETLAEPFPGPTTRALGALARETGLWLVPGTLYERDGDDVFNTAPVLSPDGELVAVYRKCFPWQPYEQVTPGRRAVTFDVPGVGRLGLAICHDGAFPELFRQLAWDGAEAVIQPVLTTTTDRAVEVVLARANAIANQVHVVSVNAPGPGALGRSVVVDPEGLVRYEAGAGEEVITDVLDLDAVARVRRYGTYGLNRVWEQLDAHGGGLDLPVYGGRYRPRPTRGEEHP